MAVVNAKPTARASSSCASAEMLKVVAAYLSRLRTGPNFVVCYLSFSKDYAVTTVIHGSMPFQFTYFRKHLNLYPFSRYIDTLFA